LSLAHKKDYNNILTNKHRRYAENLKYQIEGEIKDIKSQALLLGTTNNSTFRFCDIINCIKNDFSNYSESIKNFCEKLSAQSEDIAAETIRNIESCTSPNWLWATSTASITDDVELFSTSQYKDTDDFFINHLMDKKRIEQTLSNWQKESMIQKRYSILEQSIDAHIRKMFYLSVSTLLPQVEGLLRDILDSANKSADFGSMRKEDMKKAICTVIQDWKSKAPSPVTGWVCMLDYLMPAIVDLYEKYEPKTAIPGKLYRHGVCHGHQVDFASEKNSLRLILIIDRLIFFYAKIR